MPDWESVKAALPVGLTDEDKARRKELWQGFNVNRSMYLALFEVDAGIQKVLECEELFDAKQAIRRAYKYARTVNPKGPMDKLEYCEFRMLLIYLKGIFEVYQIFTALDKSRDKVLQLDELTAAGPRLKEAGIEVKDPAALFQQLKGTNEEVDFGEFADWAVLQGLAGPELLKQAREEEMAVGVELKAVLAGWRCCTDGSATVEDMKRLLKRLDPGFSDQDLTILLTPLVKQGAINISDFIDNILMAGVST
jgi:hypothetical protein